MTKAKLIALGGLGHTTKLLDNNFVPLNIGFIAVLLIGDWGWTWVSGQSRAMRPVLRNPCAALRASSRLTLAPPPPPDAPNARRKNCRRRTASPALYEFQGLCRQLLAAVLHQHLNTVVDGTDGADQVVTQTRTQECR